MKFFFQFLLNQLNWFNKERVSCKVSSIFNVIIIKIKNDAQMSDLKER